MDPIEQLKQLIAINSKTLNESGAVNIHGINMVGDKIKEFTKDLPIKWSEVEREGSAKFLIGESERDSNKPVVILSGHMDTVFASHDVEEKETEDKVYGSGSQDMKSGLVVMLQVLSRLHEQGNLKNIIISLSPEEEIATLHYRDVIEEISKKGDYVLVFESTLDCEPNASMNKRSVVVSRRGFRQFDLLIKGPGGHSGVLFRKEERKSTILLASEIIQKLESFSDYEKQTTLNCGLVQGGEAVNVLAPETKLSFETRFRTVEEHDRVVDSIKKMINDYKSKGDFEFELVNNRYFPPFQKTDENIPFMNLCSDIAEKMNLSFIFEERAGGSEASLFQHFNPKALILDGFGVRGEGQHTRNEFIYKETLFSTIDYVYEVVKTILE